MEIPQALAQSNTDIEDTIKLNTLLVIIDKLLNNYKSCPFLYIT